MPKAKKNRKPKPSAITADNFDGYWWDGERKPNLHASRKDFNQDMKRIKEGHESVVAAQQPELDIMLLLNKTGGRAGRRVTTEEVEAFEAEDWSKYQAVKWHGGKHAITYLFDKHGWRYAAILWRGSNDYNEDFIQAVNTLPPQCSEAIEESRAHGQRFTAAHAILQGPNEGHPVNKEGKYDLFYNSSFVKNMKLWVPFLKTNVVKHLQRRHQLFLHRAFPDHGKELLAVATNSMLADIKPSGGFLWGHHSSFALNNQTEHTTMRPHRDTRDLVTSLCGVFPFGNFDPMVQDSGALLLHEAKAKLLLRPGDFVLFPSALLTHSNVPMQRAGKQRGSLVLFTHHSLHTFVKLKGNLVKDMEGTEELEAWNKECKEYYKFFEQKLL